MANLVELGTDRTFTVRLTLRNLEPSAILSLPSVYAGNSMKEMFELVIHMFFCPVLFLCLVCDS